MIDIEKRIIEVREFVDENIRIISEIDDWKYQIICLFSLMDCFVQEKYNYDQYNNKGAFCSFVTDYDDSFNYWKEIDTISFYYHYESLFYNNDPTEFMMDGRVYYCPDLIGRQREDLFQYIDRDKYRKDLEKHQYVKLFYVLRNKIVHELNPPHGLMWSLKGTKPFYSSYSVISSRRKRDAWVLTFPFDFVKKTVMNCISNYLNECSKLKRDPFMNQDSFRDVLFSWVDD